MSGRKSKERRDAEVGFGNKSELGGKLIRLPKGIFDRLMILGLPFSDKNYAIVVSAYAPMMTNPDGLHVDQYPKR